MEVNLLTTLFCLFQVVETSTKVCIILFLHKYIIIIFSLTSQEIKSLHVWITYLIWKDVWNSIKISVQPHTSIIQAWFGSVHVNCLCEIAWNCCMHGNITDFSLITYCSMHANLLRVGNKNLKDSDIFLCQLITTQLIIETALTQ